MLHHSSAVARLSLERLLKALKLLHELRSDSQACQLSSPNLRYRLLGRKSSIMAGGSRLFHRTVLGMQVVLGQSMMLSVSIHQGFTLIIDSTRMVVTKLGQAFRGALHHSLCARSHFWGNSCSSQDSLFIALDSVREAISRLSSIPLPP